MNVESMRHDAAWVRATDGLLTDAERADLLRRTQSPPPLRGPALALLDVGRVRSPDTALTRAADQVCAGLPGDLAGHGRRVHIYGHLLARRDGISLDAEAFYVAALLHDAGLAAATPGRCFTAASVAAVESTQGAVAAGAEPTRTAARVKLAADAVALHLELGLDWHTEPEAAYVLAGSMADLWGVRAEELPPHARAEVESAACLAGSPSSINERLRIEAQAVPRGRVAALAPLVAPLISPAGAR